MANSVDKKVHQSPQDYWQNRKKSVLTGKVWPYEGRIYYLKRQTPGPGASMSGTAAINTSPDHWRRDLDLPVRKESSLNKFLTNMAQNYSCDQVKLDGIKHEILPMMTKTLEHLRKECFFFKNSSIDLVGSAPENSKIGEPDEFDFAIKMPDLAKAENGYGWVAGAATGWMMEHPSYAGMTDDDVEGQFEENIFHVMIKEYFYHTMKNYLPQTYEIIESQCHHKVQIAGTFHIMRKSDRFVVDIDICFWVTYHRQFLKETFSSDFPQRDKILAHTSDETPFVSIILPNDVTMAESPYPFATSYEERAMLQAHKPDNPYLACYRLTKIIAKLLFPKKKKEDYCVYCTDSVIASFFFKQVILFMIQHYRDKAAWGPEQLGNRLIEVFLILKTSLQLNGGKVSTLFSMEEKCIPLKETSDGTERVWSSPEMSDVFRLLGPEQELNVVQYFECLQNEWNTSQLIDEVIHLLLKLKNSGSYRICIYSR